MEDALKKLNTKAYTMTVKEDKILNQWLDKQLKTELIVKSSLQYAASYFYILKKDRSLWLVLNYWKLNQHMIKNKILLITVDTSRMQYGEGSRVIMTWLAVLK